MSSATQSEQFTREFERLNDELIAVVEGCTGEQWRQVTESEQWPAAVVAHHIAVSNQAFAGMIERLVSGETYTPSISIEDVHRMNAEHAREYANVGKPETLDKLRSGGAAVSKALGQLDDRQLEQVAGTFGGNEMTVGQVVEQIVVAHTAEHLNSIRATIQR